MTDTYTIRNKAIKQGFDTNEDIWGDPNLNAKVIDVFDTALDGVLVVTTTGGTTVLTTTNGASNAEAIYRSITVSGTLAADSIIQIPNNEKWYFVRNVTSGAYNVYVKNASESTSALIPQDSRDYYVVTDGTNTRLAMPNALQTSSGAPSNSVGNNGDYALDSTNYVLYGPKASGAWPSSGQSLIGPSGDPYYFSTGTSDTDPGTGYIGLNNATPASATALFISDSQRGGADISAYLATWDDATGNSKGTVALRSEGDVSTFAMYSITGMTDNTTYYTASGTYLSGSGTFSSGDSVGVSFYRAGDAGNDAGLAYKFSTTTTNGDPGTGYLRFNNADPSLTTEVYIDDADRNSADVSAYILTWDDSSNTVKGSLTVRESNTPATFAIFNITALTDNVGYTTLTVTAVDNSGTFGDTNNIAVEFSRAGDVGTVAAAGDGSVSAPGISWAADTDTGFYRSGTGEMQVASDGAQEMTLKVASQAEAEAGTDNLKVMTPLRVAQSVAALAPPAGSRTFTASGAVAAGDIVALNTDGTATTVFGAVATAFESDPAAFIAACYDTANDKVVVAYRDEGNGSYGTAAVGTVSADGSISFGTPVVFESAVIGDTSCCFDSVNGKVVIAYRDTGNADYGTAVVGTVSGTSISFGTPVLFRSSQIGTTSCAFDPVNNKVVIAFQDVAGPNYPRCAVGSVSGTSITFDAAIPAPEAVNSYYHKIVYEPVSGKFVYIYQNASSSNRGRGVVGTISGTSISFGTPADYNTNPSYYMTLAVEPVTGKVLCGASLSGSSYLHQVSVGTISGTSISFGTPVTVCSLNTQGGPVLIYDTNKGRFLFFAGTQSPTAAVFTLGDISGTSSSWDDLTYTTDATYSAYNALVYDPDTGFPVLFSRSNINNYGNALVLVDAPYATTAVRWIGVAAEAISDAATGTITILGGVNDQQSGLTIGATYYATNTGSLTTTETSYKIGKALSATEILIEGDA